MAKIDRCEMTNDMLSDVVISKRPNGTLRVDHMNYEKSLTHQCFSDAADVNKIMSRWLNGGPPPVSDAARAVFKDVSHGRDFQESLHLVMEVQESFDSLPADLRSQFKNDPALLLDFVSDPRNEAECVKLGLLEGDSSSTLNSVPTDGGQIPAEQSSLDVTVRTDTTVVS